MNSIRWVQIGTLLALPVVGYNLYYTFTPTLLVLLSGEPAEFGKNRTLRFSGHP